MESLSSSLDTGHFPEMVHATEGGLLVEPESAESVARGIMELLSDADRRSALGKTGQANVHQKFNDEVVAEQLLKVFRNYI